MTTNRITRGIFDVLPARVGRVHAKEMEDHGTSAVVLRACTHVGQQDFTERGESHAMIRDAQLSDTSLPDSNLARYQYQGSFILRCVVFRI